MRISFLGLSSFLIESEKGDSVLLDPYHDSPEFYLGLFFPSHIQADIVLVSHPDEDHSYLRHHLLKQRRPSKEEDPSPDVTVLLNLNLRGHLVREWNGDINIAYSFTVDGIRLLHLADNTHILTQRQIDEIGSVDILFISPPKYPNDRHIQNIQALHPSLVIPSHYVPVTDSSVELTKEQIMRWYRNRVTQDWVRNKYINEETIEMMVNVYMGARDLAAQFPESQIITSSTSSFSKKDITGSPSVCMFDDCLGI